IRMPVMDGYEVLEALKTNPETRDIPVVIMSAYQIDRDRASILDLATQLIGKPFDVEEFVAHIEEVISESEPVPVTAGEGES
ncbi:MAG: response regulator, partial [Coriobacteriia bacterium]|nr:response regulator [Coriobacteriia bacterium]